MELVDSCFSVTQRHDELRVQMVIKIYLEMLPMFLVWSVYNGGSC
jgi:hypothetical protein